MPYIFIFIDGFLLIILLITLFNAFTAPMLKKSYILKVQPFVSVLIPARNESLNIGKCLESLQRQDYADYEIIVLDDNSSDDTAKIVNEYVKKNKRIKLLKGKELPQGWTGKNWACHQLSKKAKGDILIFTDADNWYSGTAVMNTVAWIVKFRIDLFSAFPQQVTVTLPEKLIVPTVYMTVYSYLPLWFTYLLGFSSMAAANGQWLAFKREAYVMIGGHESARSEVVEDTWFARKAKKMQLKTMTAAGTGTVFSRMYANISEIWRGFSKNLFGLMGYNYFLYPFFLFILFLCYIMPYLLAFNGAYFTYALSAVLINTAIRALLWIKYKDPAVNIILNPLAVLLTIIIGINSMLAYKSGNLKWKGREIN